MLRKVGLFVVMTGALALSFSGQVDAVAPLLGSELAVVFAATNDVAALLALNEVTSIGPGSIRRWAWSVLFLSGGTVLGLNTWDALKAGTLPEPAAIAVGAGPVVLAWLLSHLVALVLTERRRAAGSASETASHAEPAPPAPAASQPTAQVVEPAVAEAPREAVGSGSDTASAPAQSAPERLHAVASVPASRDEEAGEPGALPAAEDVAASLPVRLIDRAEKFERQALQRSGGKRGLSFREAPRRLGVRYDTARAALQAARQRMADETESAPESGSRTAA